MDASLAVAIGLVVAAGLSLELRVSSAILEVSAGIALAALLPEIGSLHWVEFLGHVGMLALMFTAGFEVNPRIVRRAWKGSLSVGALSLALPFTGVFLVAHFLVGLPIMPSAVIGIGLSTTSLALVYHALKQDGALPGASGQRILAAATVVDVLSMLALAFILGDAGWGTLWLVGLLAVAMSGLPRLARWFFRRYQGSIVEAELRWVLVVVLAVGVIAENLGGVHPAAVAFAIGMAMSGVVVQHERVESKLKGLVFGLFAPIFFFHAGTQLDVSVLTPDVLGLAAGFLVVAATLKYLGSAMLARRFLNVSGTYIGVLFNYRLSFGIVAAETGLRSGILSGDQYAMILIAVVASSVLPALILRGPRNTAVETDEEPQPQTQTQTAPVQPASEYT
jgi:Kef-type K+ transport system membrane component KefB